MASPISVGTTAIVAVSSNRNRSKVRFQNVSATQTLYFTRQIGAASNVPSATNYEFQLAAATRDDINEAYIETNSTAQFNVVASASGGGLAILETVNV